MNTTRLAIAVGAAWVALAVPPVTPGLAGELAGVALPDQVTVEGRTLVLNGMGLREATFFRVDVYVAGLYLEARSSDAARIIASGGPKRLVMRFVREVDRQSLVEAWTEGFATSAGPGLSALEDRVGTLNAWMADITHGDTMTFTEIPGTGIVVEIRGQAMGTIPGDDFARALWGIWLGSHPPNPGLKKGLLGG